MLREWASSARDTHLVPERGGGFCVLLRSAARRVEDVVVVHPSVPPAHVRAERRVVANVLHLWRHSWVGAASEHTWRGGTIARPWAPIHGVDGKTVTGQESAWSVREAWALPLLVTQEVVMCRHRDALTASKSSTASVPLVFSAPRCTRCTCTRVRGQRRWRWRCGGGGDDRRRVEGDTCACSSVQVERGGERWREVERGGERWR